MVIELVSAEFAPISISLSVTSDDGLSTVGSLSTFDDAWVIQGWGGETEIYQ